MPDWKRPIERPNAWFMTSQAGSETPLGNSLYSAGSQQQFQVAFSSESGADGWASRRMHIRGVIVDTILDARGEYLGTQAPPKSAYLKNLMLGRLFRDIEILCRRSIYLGFRTYSPSLLRDAPWRIMVRDCEFPDCYASDPWPNNCTRRATSLSRARYYRYLPLWKTVKAHLKLIEVSQWKTSHWADDTIKRLYYFYFAAEFLIRQRCFRTRSCINLKLRQIWYWTRYKASQLLSKPMAEIGDFPSSIQQNQELDMYLSYIAGPPFRAFITQRGYIGLGPPLLTSGDIVVIFFGARVPRILRPRNPRTHDSEYFLVGETYAYGMMDGECIGKDEKGQVFEVH